MDNETAQAIKLMQLNIERTRRELNEQLNALTVQLDRLLPRQPTADRQGWREEIGQW